MRIQIYLDWEDESSGERMGGSVGLSIGLLTPAQSGEFRPHIGLHAGRETCLKKNVLDTDGRDSCTIMLVYLSV